MSAPRIIVFAGSVRTGSHNARLAALAAKELTLADAEVTMISLADYPMPLYDANVEEVTGAPPYAVRLKRMLAAHQGAFIATPELNASVPPLLKNALDWSSRVRERGDAPEGVYRGLTVAIGSASDERGGGAHALAALRQVLEIGCGALVLPEDIAVRDPANAFDEMDALADPDLAARLRRIAERLVQMTWRP